MRSGVQKDGLTVCFCGKIFILHKIFDKIPIYPLGYKRKIKRKFCYKMMVKIRKKG